MKSSKSSLFLMELILAILFFALSSAVCIQLFVKSHILENTSTEENHALLLCQNLSEIFLDTLPEYYNKDPEEMKQYMLSLMQTDTALPPSQDCLEETDTGVFSFALHFNENWEPCTVANSCYRIQFLYKGYAPETDTYEASTIAFRFKKNDMGIESEEIYHLDVCKHVPERKQ